MVIVEPDVGDLARRTVTKCERADLRNEVSLIGYRHGGVGEIDRGDAQLRQAPELAGVADPVLVGVLPDAQLGEARVLRVDPTVGIGVQRGQRHEAVACRVVGAKQLVDVVDRAIAVAIEDEQAVVSLNPAGALREAVGVEVEVRRCAERLRS